MPPRPQSPLRRALKSTSQDVSLNLWVETEGNPLIPEKPVNTLVSLVKIKGETDTCLLSGRCPKRQPNQKRGWEGEGSLPLLITIEHISVFT